MPEVPSAAWPLLFSAPPLGLLAWLARVRHVHRHSRREPFTVAPLRLPGESARERADELFEASMRDALIAILATFFAEACVFAAPAALRGPTGIAAFLACSAATALLGLRAKRTLVESWNHRLGAKGEQVVAQELDRLARQQYRVFHDVPFGTWNIDHVAVGPTGVFAVETKAWSKPPMGADVPARITFTGTALIRPGRGPDRSAIDQARHNARSLSAWLEKRTGGQPVPVLPVVALPGWQLKCSGYGDVVVFSATNMSSVLPSHGLGRLTDLKIKLLAAQIEAQCASPAA